MENIKAELIALFTKWWIWIIYVVLGLVAKFSYDLSMRRKINIWQALGSLGVSIAAGLVTAHYCMMNSWERMGYLLVILVTLLADKIATYIITNWKDIIAYFLRLPDDKK